MGATSDVKAAEAFAKAYTPSEDDHPDMHSRVVRYRRAAEAGDKRVVAIHARTLMRFARNVGAVDTADSTSSTSEGPTKADLVAEAEALGLSKSGSKSDLQKRIAEHRAAAGGSE